MGPATATRKDLLRSLKDIVGARVSQSAADRLSYSRDLWPRSIIGLREGQAAPYPPDVVVWPESTEEVAAIVKLAARRRVPLIPFGAGSGVCGGAAAVRGGIVLDLKRMSRVVSIDGDALEATFEAGILGE